MKWDYCCMNKYPTSGAIEKKINNRKIYLFCTSKIKKTEAQKYF